MMHLGGRRELASPLALLTQRVGGDIAGADPLPCSAVPFACGGIAVVAFVPLGFRLACSSQKRPAHRRGHPGAEQGVFGLCGIAATSSEKVVARNITNTAEVIDQGGIRLFPLCRF